MDIADPAEQVTDYIRQQTAGEQKIIAALMEIIFEAEPAMQVAIKWHRIRRKR